MERILQSFNHYIQEDNMSIIKGLVGTVAVVGLAGAVVVGGLVAKAIADVNAEKAAKDAALEPKVDEGVVQPSTRERIAAGISELLAKFSKDPDNTYGAKCDDDKSERSYPG